MALQRCMVIEMRWKRKRLSRSSPLNELMRRPRTLRKSTAELWRTPVFSTAIGCKRYDCGNTEYLLIVLIAARSAGAPTSRAVESTYIRSPPKCWQSSHDPKLGVCRRTRALEWDRQDIIVSPFSVKASEADWFFRGSNASRWESSRWHLSEHGVWQFSQEQNYTQTMETEGVDHGGISTSVWFT